MLNVAYIVADKTDAWFDMSVKQASQIADRFVFVIDRPDAHTWEVIEQAQSVKPTVVLHNRYATESKNADGSQRTIYLQWLKKNALGEHALVLDTDEILSDNSHDLFKYLALPDVNCFDIRMRHIWFGLSIEDCSFNPHMVNRRLFRVSADLSYPLVEHPILEGKINLGEIKDVQIWHLNVVKGVLSEVHKYKVQCKKSNIHTPEELLGWHLWHVMGANPSLRRFDVKELPKIVRDYCCINEKGEPILYENS